MMTVIVPLLIGGLACLGALVQQWDWVPPWRRFRTVPRPRRLVSRRVYSLALLCGFRYSYGRDALVLRFVGRRWGPVLQQLDPPRDPRVAAVTPPAIARVIDVTCQQLPHTHRAQQLWQLTAIDLDARYIWVELKRTRGAAPSQQDAAGFIRRIVADLTTRRLRLGAVVVRGDGAPHQALFDAAASSGVRLLHAPPSQRREHVADQAHRRILTTYWRHAVPNDDGRSLGALRRGLRSWVDAYNLTAPPDSAGAPAPATALSVPERALAGVESHAEAAEKRV